MEYPYQISPPPGQLGGLIAPASCRYSRETELSLLEAGYTIRLHGKKITKTELRKENNGNNQRKPQRRI
jgi:hypothetical protein